MIPISRRSGAALAALPLALLLSLSACGTSQDAASDDSSGEAETVELEDNHGTQTVEVPADSVASTDNRSFETLCDWGVDLVAAPQPLIPDTIDCYHDEATLDIGNHREPDLEALAGADPSVVINGQRFADHYEPIQELLPEATLLDYEPRDGQDFFDELQRQTTALGTLFQKETEAEELNTALDDAAERVGETYQEGDTVMAVNVSGGEIGYVAPGKGRTLGPLFDEFGFTPALEIEGASEDHQGDDISVEAIAESNPDWIIVLDRDAAVSTAQDAAPAQDVIEGAEALQDVTAVQEGHVYYAPGDTYTNESIETYTEIFNGLADSFEGAKS